jgi:membrane protease YdiL (CAAX protease family)
MNRKVKHFLAFTYIFSWLIWLPSVLSGFGFIYFPVDDTTALLIGGLSPIIAALFIEYRINGFSGITRIVKRSFDFRIKWKWVIIIFLLPLLFNLLSRILFGIFSDRLPESELLQSPLMIIPLFVIMYLIGGGLNEEVGWRNYVLEEFQKKHNALNASIILGILWILWHLPLFFMSNTNQGNLPFWLFILSVLPLSVMLTWIYNNTKGSISAVAIFHAMGNLSHEIFRVFPTQNNQDLTGVYIFTALYYIAAILIVLIYGKERLVRFHE